MEIFQEHTYGDHIAGVYDDWYTDYDKAALTVLHELARGGRALELGIGTGRVALPLQAMGVEVHGIDASEAMVAHLRTKPGGENLPVTMGNFADVAVEGKFDLIYVMFNTFFALLTQEEQVACFRNIAAHLQPDGIFVMEGFVPDLARFQARQTVRAIEVTVEEARLEISRLDPLNQQVSAHIAVLTNDSVRLYPVKLRFAWPSELDLMARLAGMRLKERWGNWEKAPFTAESLRHVSVYAVV